MPLDGGHERGFLAADEGARAQPQLKVKAEAGVEDVAAQQAVVPGLGDGDFQPLDGDGVFRADINVSLAGAHGIAGDGHGLQHTVGVALQHGAVHKRAGVALVGVAGHEFYPVLAGCVGGELPFQAGGEACAAPPADAALLDGVDDLLRGLLGEGPGQGAVAAGADVLVDVFRVNDAAVAQGDAQLLLVEDRVGQGGDGLRAFVFHMEQALDDAALYEVLGDDFGHVLGGDLGVAGAFGINHDDGPHGAEAEAAGFHHLDLAVQPLGGQLALQRGEDLGACRRGAAGAGANQNMGTYQMHITAPLLRRRRWYIPLQCGGSPGAR
ncbi:hypothetical protein SDC9_122992 [bioreactor metagenome]|uniref:Uncharacterized protein n=1 Tax=bioreactor metagenome TaxID=1076179 RepID=A0A645CGC5_9ZZZZ